MNIIDKNYFKEYEVKKSKFICCLYYINKFEDIDNILSLIKNKYKDADHYCYAYIFDNKQKYSDDKEPSGTAGLPILNILKKKNLDNILCVVVRYFGGIKLGAGGLLRAYSKATSNALDDINLIKKQEYLKVKIIFSYDNINNIEYIIKNYNILKKNYDIDITYLLEIPKEKVNDIIKELKDKCRKIEIE